jgi:hypothetical protein
MFCDHVNLFGTDSGSRRQLRDRHFDQISSFEAAVQEGGHLEFGAGQRVKMLIHQLIQIAHSICSNYTLTNVPATDELPSPSAGQRLKIILPASLKINNLLPPR